MKPITYLSGDALNPVEVSGRKFICHIVNTWGVMGAGIALSIRKKWPSVYNAYQTWSEEKGKFKLGEVQFVKVDKDTSVVNMIGQEGLGYKAGFPPPIRYNAVDSCLKKVAEACKKYNASVAMPKIGCGLAGGKWSEIEPLIIKNLCEQDIAVYVYEL